VKVLLDQGLPRGAVGELRRLGIDVVHTGDIDMSGASDREILDYARRDNRTVVTLDADFHALMALSNARSPSVVRIRIEGLRAERLADLVARVLSLCQTDLEAGAMVTVEERRVRVRSVPLLR